MEIRFATPNDVDDILRLIHELAVFEKEPDAVKTTREDLLRDGFGDKPYFETLVCTVDGKVQGMALFFYFWSTWEGRPSMYLEDLFVSDSQRGKGLGMALLRECGKIAVEKNCKRFEWEVLDWNTPARDFYHNIGARHMQGWLPYRLDGQELLDFVKEN